MFNVTSEASMHCITLYNVFSVYRRMFSTSGEGGVQYIGEGVFSTSGGYHEYIGEIS